MNAQDYIKETITKNPVVVFMKGSPEMPQCGFSAQTIKCLSAAGATTVVGIDVLADPTIRQGVKDFTQWPTIPQVFINGEFVGGCDIVTEMYQSGQLKEVLEKK